MDCECPGRNNNNKKNGGIIVYVLFICLFVIFPDELIGFLFTV